MSTGFEGSRMCLGKRKESMPDGGALFILKPDILRCAFAQRGGKTLKSIKQTKRGGEETYQVHGLEDST